MHDNARGIIADNDGAYIESSAPRFYTSTMSNNYNGGYPPRDDNPTQGIPRVPDNPDYHHERSYHSQYYAPQGKEYVGGYGSGNLNRRPANQVLTAALFTILILVLLIGVGGGSYYAFRHFTANTAADSPVTVTVTAPVPTTAQASPHSSSSTPPSTTSTPSSTVASAYLTGTTTIPALTTSGWGGEGPSCTDGDTAVFAGLANEGRMVICSSSSGPYYRGLWLGQSYENANVTGADGSWTVDASPVIFRISKNELIISKNGSTIKTYRFINSWVLHTN